MEIQPQSGAFLDQNVTSCTLKCRPQRLQSRRRVCSPLSRGTFMALATLNCTTEQLQGANAQLLASKRYLRAEAVPAATLPCPNELLPSCAEPLAITDVENENDSSNDLTSFDNNTDSHSASKATEYFDISPLVLKVMLEEKLKLDNILEEQQREIEEVHGNIEQYKADVLRLEMELARVAALGQKQESGKERNGALRSYFR